MNMEHEDQNAVANSAYNPFPEPQTIPAGWDTDGMFSTLQTDFTFNENELVEHEDQ